MDYRIYLIGAGAIARQHAAAAASLPGCSRLLVTDRDPAVLAAFLAEHPQAEAAADVAQLLAEPARPGDIVIVATPPIVHHELSSAAVASGRHVLCEKPLMRDLDEARDLLTRARHAGVHLACCSSRFRDTPVARRVRELLAQEAVGRPYHLNWIDRRPRNRSGIEYQPQTKWFLDRSYNGGGCLMDWGPYDAACLDELLRPDRITVLQAWSARPQTAIDPPDVVDDVEQHVGATLVYERDDGLRVVVDYERSACCHGQARNLHEIEGDAGAIRWDWVGMGEARVVQVADVDGRPAEEEEQLEPQTGADIHARPLHAFAAFLAGEENPALVDGDAVFAFALLQAIYRCAEQAAPITIERSEYA